jgi:phosphoglycerate dehydrogenase-like enzyme
MTVPVLIPDDVGMRMLATCDGVLAVRYDTRVDHCPEAEVLVAWQLPLTDLLALITQLPRLRLVQALTSGVEGWVGRLPEGIALANARGASGAACAEWVVATLLSHYRELPRFAASQARRVWAPGETGTLNGKRVLTVGAGDLATRLRDLLIPFGVSVTLTARTARPGVRPASELPDLAGTHDVTVLMAPLTEQTRHLVDADYLSRMPDGAVLVNVARGAVVDTEALIAELHRGRLHAILDVTDPEPLPPGHPLWATAGAQITPHVAAGTYGETERSWSVAVAQIASFIRGHRPDNLI